MSWGEPVNLDVMDEQEYEGTFTSGYGDSRSGGTRKHLGGDVAGEPGTPIYSKGNITFIQGRQGGTNLRYNDYWAHFRDEDTGLEYRLAHIGDISGLTPGQKFSKGETITTIGNAINRPHVHIQVYDPNTGESMDWGGKGGLERGSKVSVSNILGKIGEWLGPSSAQAAQGGWGEPVDISKLGKQTGWGEPVNLNDETGTSQQVEPSATPGFEGPVYPEATPGPKLSTPEQTKQRQLEADIQTGLPDSDTLAQFGTKVKPEHLGIPFIPLEYAISEVGKRTLRPVMEYAFPKATKEELDLAEHGLEFLATLGLAPSYLKGISFGIDYLKAAGYKYAPDFVFKPGAKIGLPEPIPLSEAKMARVNEFTKERLMAERATGEAVVEPPVAAEKSIPEPGKVVPETPVSVELTPKVEAKPVENGIIPASEPTQPTPTPAKEPYKLGSGPSTENIVQGAKKIAKLPYPQELKNTLLDTIAPTMHSQEHLDTAVSLGANLGSMNRRAENTMKVLQKPRKMFDKLGVHDPNLPPEQNPAFDFASKMSTGLPQSSAELTVLEKNIEKMLAQRTDLLEKVGAPLPPEKIRENYFPGMWKTESVKAFNQAIAEGIQRGAIDPETFDPNTALPQVRIAIKTRVQDLLSQGQGSDSDALKYFSRRPAKGSESFRKQKVFDDWFTGIDYGLVPESNNPLDLVTLKLAELDRSIMMNGFFREQEAKGNIMNVTLGGTPMKEADRATFNPGEWTRLPDDEPYGKIWSREGGSLQLNGYRMFKKPVADILNNYLSKGLYNNPYYRGLMAVGNLLNQSQLGMGSLFHGGFTTIEAQVNAGADLIQDVYGLAKGNRTVGQLVNTAKKLPVAMFTAPAKGSKILKEFQYPTVDIPDDVPVGQLLQSNRYPQAVTNVQIIAKAVELAGGKTTMDVGLRTNQEDKMIRDWYSGKKLKAVMRSPIAFTEYSMKPLMTYYVPRQKLAVFGEMVGRIIEQHPNKTLNELRGMFRDNYNHVEATLGQVGYDRLFIKNTAKNTLQLLMRAPGWTGGTITQVGGAPIDTVKFFNEWQKTGKAPEEFPRRIAYVLSLGMTIIGTNAILTKAFTGKWPETFKDALTFKDARGQAWMLPSYMKDIYSWGTNAGHTAVSKLHPVFSLAGEIARGTDYYGNQIRNPEDPYSTQLKDSLIHGVASFEPFWTRGARKAGEKEGGITDTLKKSPGKIIAPEVGVMPAPRAYTATNTDKIMDEYSNNMGQQVRSQEDAALYRLRRRAGELVREGKKQEAWELIKPTVEKNKIPEKKAVKWLMDSEEDPQIRRFKNMNRTVGGKDSLGWQLKALSQANQEEFNKLASITLNKIQTAIDKENTETLERNKAAMLKFGKQLEAYKEGKYK
jgi:hypothetical protein